MLSTALMPLGKFKGFLETEFTGHYHVSVIQCDDETWLFTMFPTRSFVTVKFYLHCRPPRCALPERNYGHIQLTSLFQDEPNRVVSLLPCQFSPSSQLYTRNMSNKANSRHHNQRLFGLFEHYVLPCISTTTSKRA